MTLWLDDLLRYNNLRKLNLDKGSVGQELLFDCNHHLLSLLHTRFGMMETGQLVLCHRKDNLDGNDQGMEEEEVVETD